MTRRFVHIMNGKKLHMDSNKIHMFKKHRKTVDNTTHSKVEKDVAGFGQVFSKNLDQDGTKINKGDGLKGLNRHIGFLNFSKPHRKRGEGLISKQHNDNISFII